MRVARSEFESQAPRHSRAPILRYENENAKQTDENKSATARETVSIQSEDVFEPPESFLLALQGEDSD